VLQLLKRAKLHTEVPPAFEKCKKYLLFFDSISANFNFFITESSLEFLSKNTVLVKLSVKLKTAFRKKPESSMPEDAMLDSEQAFIEDIQYFGLETSLSK
jgi:hypothetical protein